METRCGSSVDKFSELPSSITEIILMHLPMRDMARTSLLSRSWRFRWVHVPQLLFDGDLMKYQSEGRSNADNLSMVFGILLQHRGPIRKFKLDMSRWSDYAGVEKIISFLAINGIQDLDLTTERVFGNSHKLPYSIFSCVELEHLSLTRCVLHPMIFKGFRELVTLELSNIKFDNDSEISISDCPFLQIFRLHCMNMRISLSIDAPKLESLFLRCPFGKVCIEKAPVLKVLSFEAISFKYVYMGKTIELNQFLSYLPLLESLCLSSSLMGSFPIVAVNELPITLSNVTILHLSCMDSSLTGLRHFTVWLIRSSPNVTKIEFLHCKGSKRFRPRVNPKRFRPRVNPEKLDCRLMKLREARFELEVDLRFYLEFMKFILLISPELETLYIKLASNEIQESDYKNLLRLKCSRRASPKAEIVLQGVDLENE